MTTISCSRHSRLCTLRPAHCIKLASRYAGREKKLLWTMKVITMLCYSVRRDNRDVPERNSVLLVNRIRSLSPGSASAVKGSTRRSRLGPLPPRRRFLSIISSGVVPRAGGVVTSRANAAGDMVSGQMSKKTPNVSPPE